MDSKLETRLMTEGVQSLENQEKKNKEKEAQPVLFTFTTQAKYDENFNPNRG